MMAKTMLETGREHDVPSGEIEECISGLDHDEPEVRKGLWTQLAAKLRALPGPLPLGSLRRMTDRMAEERDYGLLRPAIVAIVRALVSQLSTPGPAHESDAPKCFGKWFWKEFHYPSRVYRIADPGRKRRDEEATICMARLLSHRDYPKTLFRCEEPDHFAPQDADFKDVAAVAFLGRLGLYGPEALKSWQDDRHRWRYSLREQSRPADLPRGEVDPRYHSVTVAPRGGTPQPPYVTEQDDRTRTDYGLIRRYVISWNGRSRVVIQIAGCSSLGTLAAAEFASRILLSPEWDGRLIPLPPAIHDKSRVEALVRVTAGLQGSASGWTLGDLSILDLRVDNHVWDEEAYAWRLTPHEVVTIEFDSEDARRHYQCEVPAAEILLDGDKARFNRGSENQRLCLALFMLGAGQAATVGLDELAAQAWIWNDALPKDAGHVRRRLRNPHFQQQIGADFEIEGAHCHLRPKIEVTVSGRSPGPGKPK
jgi:hypothetical protein